MISTPLVLAGIVRVALLAALTGTTGAASHNAFREQIEADWLRQDAVRGRAVDTTPTYPIAKTVKQGLELAENLQRLGTVATAEEATLRDVQRQLASGLANSEWRRAYFRVRWAVRRLRSAAPAVAPPLGTARQLRPGVELPRGSAANRRAAARPLRRELPPAAVARCG